MYLFIYLFIYSVICLFIYSFVDFIVFFNVTLSVHVIGLLIHLFIKMMVTEFFHSCSIMRISGVQSDLAVHTTIQIHCVKITDMFILYTT